MDVRVCGRIPVGQPLSLHEPSGHSPGIVAEPVKSGHRGHAALRSAAATPPPLYSRSWVFKFFFRFFRRLTLQHLLHLAAVNRPALASLAQLPAAMIAIEMTSRARAIHDHDDTILCYTTATTV